MYSRKIDGVITIVGYDITNVLKIEQVIELKKLPVHTSMVRLVVEPVTS